MQNCIWIVLLTLLEHLSIENLYPKFLKIAEAPPTDDDTPMLVYLFPHLVPQWNRLFDSGLEKALWEKIKPILSSTDRQIHGKFMFGNASEGLPWCMDYSFGRSIVSDYLSKHPNVSFLELIAIPSKELLSEYQLFY